MSCWYFILIYNLLNHWSCGITSKLNSKYNWYCSEIFSVIGSTIFFPNFLESIDSWKIKYIHINLKIFKYTCNLQYLPIIKWRKYFELIYFPDIQHQKDMNILNICSINKYFHYFEEKIDEFMNLITLFHKS